MRHGTWLGVVIGLSASAVMACASGGSSNNIVADTGATGTGGKSDAGTGNTTAGSDAATTGSGTAGDDVTSKSETDAGCGYCQPGWECGPDGCGGECGTCDTGKTCDKAKHVCVKDVVKPNLLKFGERCGESGTCTRQTFDATAQAWVANPAWPNCVNGQCETGLCLSGIGGAPVCSKTCTLGPDADKLDAEGNAGADGVADDPATSECTGATDGPVGAKFNCGTYNDITDANPVAFCMPGTTFKACKSNTDCPTGESCQLHPIRGAYTAICVASGKNGVGPSHLCDDSAKEPKIPLCEATNNCFGIGCFGFCKTSAECVTTKGACTGGKCKDSAATTCATDEDCSAWTCQKDHNLFGDNGGAPPPLFDVCWPRTCGVNTDCIDGDFHCRFFTNGKSGEAFAIQNICERNAAGAVKLGEECDADPDDNKTLPECGGLCLNSGTCSVLCKTDADCASTTGSFLCGIDEIPFDTNADKEDDKVLPLGYCRPFAGTKTPCKADKDCGTGGKEVCNPIEVQLADGTFDLKGLCTEINPKEGDIGDLCGAKTGVNCKSGFCLGADETNPGFCTSMCQGKADCGDGKEIPIDGTAYKFFCRSYLYSWNITYDKQDDNIYFGLCVPVAAADSSLADCSADFKCAAGQECYPSAIAFGANGEGKVEWNCRANTFYDSKNAKQVPTGKTGAACDIKGESDDPALNCEKGFCIDDTKKGAGFCTAFCKTDAECSGIDKGVCGQLVSIDRPGTDKDVTIGLCRKAASCSQCVDDSDCAAGYMCGNVGGIGNLYDPRCVPACKVDADCVGKDGGPSCKASSDKKGTPTAAMGCMPKSDAPCK